MYRLGNEMKEGCYWMKEGERKCRLCGDIEETWEHVWEICGKDVNEKGGWQENIGRILGEDGEGEAWIETLERKRRTEEKDEGKQEREREVGRAGKQRGRKKKKKKCKK